MHPFFYKYFFFFVQKRLKKMMKISLDIQKIKAHSSYKGSIKIRIKIGENLVLATERAFQRKGFYSFLEKHIVKLDYNDCSYVHLCLVSETNHRLAEITLFFGKFKSMEQMKLEDYDGNKYEMHYSVEELENENKKGHMNMNKIKSKSFADEEPQFFRDAFGKPEILRMGVLVYNFAQRLDPVVYLYAKLRYIICWKNPMLTFGLGVLLTIILMNMKMSILLGGLILYCFRDVIFQKIEKAQKYKNIYNRYMVPQENIFLVQEMMDIYCSAYEWMAGFVFRHDKTLLINSIKIVCKMGVVMILLLFLFNVEHLMVLTVWSVLIMASPLSSGLKKIMKPTLTTLVSEYTKIMDKITTEIRSIISASGVNKEPCDTLREFYVYHYQRWNLFSGWQEDHLKFSDKSYECEAIMQKKSPHGWYWISNWQLDTSGDYDEFGYQYSNDFLNFFSSTVFLANKRRRKWRRRCVKVKQNENNPEK